MIGSQQKRVSARCHYPLVSGEAIISSGLREWNFCWAIGILGLCGVEFHNWAKARLVRAEVDWEGSWWRKLNR